MNFLANPQSFEPEALRFILPGPANSASGPVTSTQVDTFTSLLVSSQTCYSDRPVPIGLYGTSRLLQAPDGKMTLLVSRDHLSLSQGPSPDSQVCCRKANGLQPSSGHDHFMTKAVILLWREGRVMRERYLEISDKDCCLQTWFPQACHHT